jgi:hypothetical protein
MAAFPGSTGKSKGTHVTFKVALVGCGKAAETHVAGIRRLSTARVCDLEPLMATMDGRPVPDSDRLTWSDQPCMSPVSPMCPWLLYEPTGPQVFVGLDELRSICKPIANRSEAMRPGFGTKKARREPLFRSSQSGICWVFRVIEPHKLGFIFLGCSWAW